MTASTITRTVLALAGVVLCTSCTTAGSEEETTTTTTGPSITAADPGTAQPTTTGSSGTSQSSVNPQDTVAAATQVAGQTFDAATKYLTARENAASHYQKTPNSWVDEAKPAMTPAFYKQLSSADAGPGEYAWGAAHTGGIKIKVSTECATYPAIPQTATTQTITCSVRDAVVDKNGKPYPLAQVPPQWPFAGEQPMALLRMEKVGNQWLVAGDDTGQAG